VKSLEIRVEGSGLRDQGFGFRVQGLGFMDQGVGFRRSGLRVPGSDFRVYGRREESRAPTRSPCVASNHRFVAIWVFLSW
jgi:hypothetical protein